MSFFACIFDTMNIFTSKLLAWYAQYKRDLPWRHSKGPYAVWLSEVILQQTRVAQGLPYYERFLAQYPTVKDLANANEDEVLKLWQGLGYYSRARNLHKAAKEVAYQQNGIFPNTYKKLIALPGVGPYTASAIASICFDAPAAVVDGNVYRVLARYFDIEIPINKPEGVRYFQELAQSLIDTKAPGIYNQAIMEFGAMQCTPKQPLCTSCPLEESCQSRANNSVASRPQKIKAKAIKNRFFHYLVPFDSKQNTLLQRREGKDIWHGLYEFPLLEADCILTEKALKSHPDLPAWATTAKWTKFEDEVMRHKLSHQTLHTHFWILEEVEKQLPTPWGDVSNFGVSRLTERFLQKFNR